MASLFSRYLSRPITDLKAAAERIAKGDFNIRINPHSTDEVGMLSESFNSMAGSLKKEEELRRHLMSNVAHELRTPLTIMKTQIEAVTDGVVGTEEGIENIRKENERLIRLVEGIEDITAAEASFLGKVEETPINLKGFLSGLIREMHPAFKEKGLSIELMDNSDLFVVSDVGKLEKIVRNIISNALKFTENGGVWIDYGVLGKEFFIDIRDSGKGIPEDKLTLIFNRYYRLEKTGKGGLGLGLAIVKELVTVLGGRIEVSSAVGSGTTFKMFLPLKPA
ncbi:MAG: HAMP domain-containing sensor histidine kinase, partial [Deltaproteobacteria bacterium]